MRSKEMYELVDAIAPFSLSRAYCEAFGAYDNSGLLVDCGRDVKKALFSLDLSAAAVKRAKELGAELIVTHHPAIYAPLKSLTPEGAGANILAAAREGISVLSAHLNLDMAAGGIDESLMHGLGGEQALALYERLEGGAYGRVFDVEEAPLAAYAARVKETFCTERLVVYGDRPVKRVASFCGAGMDEKSVSFALQAGADTFVSSDPKHHLVAMATEGGMNVLLLTHYAAENYGFKRFFGRVKEKTDIECAFFEDARLL